MTDKVEVDGVLKNVYFEQIFDKRIALGNIYDDRKGRFNDGDSIHTSAITKQEGDVIWTRNSVYRIEVIEASPPVRDDLFKREVGQPRNPARIPHLINLLHIAWAQSPDMRMGQLLTAAAGLAGNASDNIRNAEEEVFAKGLLLLIKENHDAGD